MLRLASVISLMMLLGTGAAWAQEMMTFQELESYLC